MMLWIGGGDSFIEPGQHRHGHVEVVMGEGSGDVLALGHSDALGRVRDPRPVTFEIRLCGRLEVNAVAASMAVAFREVHQVPLPGVGLALHHVAEWLASNLFDPRRIIRCPFVVHLLAGGLRFGLWGGRGRAGWRGRGALHRVFESRRWDDRQTGLRVRRRRRMRAGP